MRIESKRLQTVEEYYFSRKLKEIARMNATGSRVLNLGIGSPDLAPSPDVLEALSESASDPGNHAYQPYIGIPGLRNVISDWYQKYFEVALQPDSEVLPLIGSKEGIMHVSMALLDPTDEVLVPNPGYPAYATAARLTGAKVRTYTLSERGGWLPDIDTLERDGVENVKLMWLNYPHMPTGSNANEDIFEQLLSFSRRHGIILVNDNPYAFILNDNPLSLLKNRLHDDLVLELNSLSKSHNMAGWRVGMLVGNAMLVQHALTFKSNMDSGMFKPVQEAAIVALRLDQGWYDTLNKTYEQRRKYAWELLDTLGCTYDPHSTGMFVWAKIPEKESSGEALSEKVLQSNRIFLTPGFIFGHAGDQFIRVSLCTPDHLWEEALDRMKSLKHQ